MKLLLEHLPASVAIGALGWSLSGDPLCILVALIAGWMIDADHLVDFGLYLKRVGLRADLSLLKNGRYFKLNGKVMVPLHSWEITSALASMSILAPDSSWVWLCAALAHGLHLWQDHKNYGVRPTGYWLCFRFTYGFAHERFCK